MAGKSIKNMKNSPPLTDVQKAQILGDNLRKPLAISIFKLHAPRQIISLWDMVKVFLPDILSRWMEIERTAAICEASAYDPAKKHCTLTPDDHAHLHKMANDLQFICSQLELERASDQLGQFVDTIDNQGTNPVSINNLLQNLMSTIKTEMGERIFTRIPHAQNRFFERDDLLGPEAAKCFPEAAADIKAAGNCIAADLNNAAIFHLMCVANFGLIRIARWLRVVIKRTPLEFAEWQRMIEKIEKKLKQKSIGAGKSKREQDEIRTFCNKILVKINEFKDIRNTVCHARGDYGLQHALAILDDVREFMERLALKIR
jgi:hypothetical protein